MTKMAFIAGIFALIAGVQQTAVAAPGGVMAVCAPDLQTLCPNMAGPDQRKCLMANTDKVSQACGTAIANAKSENKVMRQSCAADIKQFCGTTPPGPERHKCVVANTPNFSQACQSAMTTK